MASLRIFPLSRRLRIALSISLASLFLASLFLLQAHAQTVSTPPSADGIVSVSPNVASESSTKTPKPELHIANDGSILLRGAHVTSVSGGTVHAEMIWGSSTYTWAIDTRYGTQYYDSKGEKESLADIQTGDTISAAGMLTQSGAESTIEARFVRE